MVVCRIKASSRAFACFCLSLRWGIHFSHPFLGTYEVIQLFELGNLSGTPFQSGMTLIPIPSYHGMDATYHSTSYHSIQFHSIPPHTIPYHTIPYHTIPPHAIPYHTIPSFHSCHMVSGVLFRKYENYFSRLQY